MLDGITVLSQTAIEDASMVLVLVPAFLIFIVAIVGCVLGDVETHISGIVCVGLAFAVALVAYEIVKCPTDKYEYECVIDESVSMTEFCDRYEIIEQRGEIYVIREKDND